MKILKTIAILFLMLFASPIFSQDGVIVNTPPYKAHAEGWLVNLEEARLLSLKTGKPIMANFTGTDWCGWCKKLKFEVFDKDEFKKWAEKNVVLLEVDFPRKFQLPDDIKQQNSGLQQAFQVTGYPTIWVFNIGKDEKGLYTIEALGKTGYVNGVAAFTDGVDAMIKQAKEK